MISFFERHPKIRVALNLHAYGPLFIIPFNFDESAGNDFLKEDHEPAYKFYEEVYWNAGVPQSYTFGNGMITIGYTANGEASDWMLGERGVYAMSPELGISDRRSDYFFINSNKVLKDLCETNI